MSDAAARATEARTAPSTAPDRAGWLLALAGLASVAAGLVQHRLWQELPVPRPLESLALLLGLVALALPIAWLWRRSLALCLLLATGLVTLQLLGPRTVLAAALLGLAAASLGRRIGGASGIPGTARLGAGLAGLAAIVGWTLPFPVHSPLTHALLCLGLIALGGRGLGRDLHAAVDALDREARRAPWAAMLACAALALTASHAWLPTLLFDDLAYHLGLPSQLARLHYYRMDAASQAWALGAVAR
ncbi:MAG: hypothetical protein KatS3mg126_1705 [Lysobacteraceae bacterium]|nr:MAG: hypothetical protein KatS3mg126_1705 [Xanthomonadaceae bacterium]